MVRRYNFDFNVMMYNTYLMLAAMAAGRDVSQCPDDYLPRARRLEPFLARCREEGTSSFSLLEDGSEARETNALRYPPGAFFPPDLADLPDLLRQEAKFDLSPIEQGEEMFAHQLLSTLVAEDPAVFGSENLERFCRVYVPQCLRAGTYLQMPGTLPEDVNCPDGSYHDNRPQLFATGLLELAWTGLALRRVPFGLAVRAGQRVRRIENYGYAGSTLDVTLKGEGPAVAAVRINGVDLPGSCQLPESWLTGQNHVEVVRGDRPDGPGRLTTSTVRLADVQDRGDGSLRYSLVAYGKNQLAFDGRIAAADLRDQSDKQVEFRLRQAGGWDYLDFEGTGEFALTIKPDA
jgi:hypothetical protein